jgi:CRISPR/Cas system-associated endonuclease Cas1
LEEWRDMIVDSMIWNLIKSWETCHDIDCDGTIKKLSSKEK